LDSCGSHRQFLAAVADGETALVPPETLVHLKSCPDCAAEIHAHRLLTSRLKEAGDGLVQTAPNQRLVRPMLSRLRVIAALAVALILVGATGVGWFVFSRPDPVQAAVNASSQPLQIESSDPARVAQWCLQASGKALPAIQLDGMRVVGARMDRIASTGVVTVVYSGPAGARVTVGWLEGPVPSGSGVENRKLSGREILIVHANVGTAVVTGSSNDAMWQTAAAIESART
jgi:hypothetical protein